MVAVHARLPQRGALVTAVRVMGAARRREPEPTVHPGHRWAEIIEESGHAQRLIARELGISEKHLSRIVHGRALPSAQLTVAFAKLMGVKPEGLWHVRTQYELNRALGNVEEDGGR